MYAARATAITNVVAPNVDSHARLVRELRTEIAALREALRNAQTATALALSKAARVGTGGEVSDVT